MGTGTTLKQALDALMPRSKGEESSVSFDHIELDEEEIEAALSRAREEKYYRLKRIAYNEKLNADRIPKSYTYEDLYVAFKKVLLVDADNGDIVKQLCYYFSGDGRCVYNLQKGLLLVGGVGIGKSTLMDFFKRNQRFSYRVISCRDVESDFSSEGEKSVQNCSYNVQITSNSSPFCQTEIGFCFDDLGTEANAKHYGKEKNVMAEIILNRYDNKLPLTSTHITTNLTAEELKAQYGSRVTDRMREMFNIIQFPATSKSRR